jgi:plasmid stabilization system protein ParE
MTLLIGPEARKDIMAAAEWYDERQAGLGPQFVAAIEQTFAQIAAGPKRFAQAHRGLRRALVHKYPYAVYFEDRGANQIVLAVVHQRRDPKVIDERFEQ